MRKKKPPEPQGTPAWMTTYGDMVTLLLTFFVLMYAFSTIDTQKYLQIANSLKGALGGNIGVLNQGISVERKSEFASVIAARKVFDQLQKILSKKGLEGKIELSENEKGITISFKEKLFFNIGSADILSEGYLILTEVGSILAEQTFPIRIEGHTCDLPIRNNKFPSNWELSATRAVNVARFLTEKNNLNPTKVSISAFGQFKPLVPNTSEENRARNRRVDIVILVNPEKITN